MEKTEKKPKHRKPALNFMKCFLLMNWGVMVFAICADIFLSWNMREPLAATTQAVIGFVNVFSTGGYIYQNTTRHKSLNDNGLRVSDCGATERIPVGNDADI
jgi:hypothetical protein